MESSTENLTTPHGAAIEIVETGGVHHGPLIPRSVRINGVEVLVAEHGVEIFPGDPGAHLPTSVTLTLYPSSLVIRSED